ncbi:MAG: hypothetical protein GKR90_20300 [Pseudomonadales bacterium]|nr:hypothetical protein [Pseudomonadales bacterium]
MTAILLVFWRICIFRGGPDSVPANTTLLAIVIFASALTSLIASSFLQTILPPPPPTDVMDVEIVSSEFNLVTSVVVSQASTAGLVWLILALMSLNSRLYQTLTAVFGTDIILTSVSTLGILIATLVSPALSQIAFLGMFFWTVGTFGFILHKALEISLGLGVAAALFVMIFTIAITQVTTSL